MVMVRGTSALRLRLPSDAIDRASFGQTNADGVANSGMGSALWHHP